MAGEQYIYKFENGINYFRGNNGSGKTVFYHFMDYMFGASDNISKKPWFAGSLLQASLKISQDGIEYILTRTMEPEINYFCYKDEPNPKAIGYDEYKDKLNSIFTKNERLLKDIRNFTEENLSYRTFTMFNFLGEKHQGILNNFLDKCSQTEYAVKVNSILNFIFNKNLEQIFELKKELEAIEKELELLESKSQQLDFVCQHVNLQLYKLNIKISYNGKNAKDIRLALNQIKNLNNNPSAIRERPISEIVAMYNNIDEQIKIYENTLADNRNIEKENKNRMKLLSSFSEIIDSHSDFQYLIEPLAELVGELDKSIAFNKYVNNDNTISELKKQREILKNEIANSEIRFKCFNISEKKRAIAVIEEYLGIDVEFDPDDIKLKRKRIRELKEEIRILQNSDDTQKVKQLSENITKLYTSAKGISQLVNDDIEQLNFHIQYVKRGNILQPMLTTDEGENNYYTGSMARHTLMQLCGYLCFLDLLLKEQRYPLIPILVIDHISKPFDQSNQKTLGAVFENAYKHIGKDRLQTFIFDDEAYEDLDIVPDHYENLITETKSGFNPFYSKS